METEKSWPQKQLSSSATTSSCRKKKSENATLFEDVRDHIDEFMHATADEHKSCVTKTIQKMFGMSKVIAERGKEEAKGFESSLPLQSTVSD